MKVAIVHEHFTQSGGAERVVRVLHEIWPEAPIFALVHDKEKGPAWLADCDVRTSMIQRLPGGVAHLQWYLWLMPAAVEKYDLSDFDVVISSASAFAKGIVTDPKTLHVCYCHSPTRYLWNDAHRYHKELKYPTFLRKLIPLILTPLRVWDRASADRVDQFIANSVFVQKRIKKYYKAESHLIYPPVDVSRFVATAKKEQYFLAGGRLTAYKRFDLVIAAFNKLGLPLKIFGDGPEMDNLKAIADVNIEFVGKISDDEQVALYQQAQAFINPQEEDFGITVVEAMAAGTPVIAYGSGGALETVIPGKTGLLFHEQTEEALLEALRTFRSTNFDAAAIRAHAETFSTERFKRELKEFVAQTHERYKKEYTVSISS